ncbi:MAG TPA: GNAT family N-acetyltransferase [Rhizomicrobium sp.]|nr:GNAT family N-acetyltransferase [Rhizomicrobium sp.]
MILTTARLTMRPQALADAPALFAILSDTAAMRFWNRSRITRLAVVEDLMREQQAAMESGLCRYWTLVRDGKAIGSVDLSLIEGGSAELGFLLRSDCWGQGLASEAVGAVIAHGFGSMGLTHVAAATQTGNRAAARVLEKNGFVHMQTRQVLLAGDERRECAFYRHEGLPQP